MLNNKTETHIVILAGGQGTRFWPISRIKRPKQFLSISTDGESLIQATARRSAKLSNNQIVVTNVLHQILVKEHLPQAELLIEPHARNTAASIAFAAMHLAHRNPEAVMVVLPADHAVKDEERLRTYLDRAITLAAKEKALVTIGIKPSLAHTGYGYIKCGQSIEPGINQVSRFYEKPSLERAQRYLESGEYFWNSGMFVWRASVILEAIAEYLPALHAGLMRIQEVYGSAKESEVTEQVFKELESISIDFGVLEHARNCVVVAADGLGWNDVGSWDAWAEHFAKDHDQNLIHGDVIAIDSKNCVVHAHDRLVAVLGLDDIVVIESNDAVLVCPRERVQDVKKIVEALKNAGRNEYM